VIRRSLMPAGSLIGGTAALGGEVEDMTILKALTALRILVYQL